MQRLDLAHAHRLLEHIFAGLEPTALAGGGRGSCEDIRAGDDARLFELGGDAEDAAAALDQEGLVGGERAGLR